MDLDEDRTEGQEDDDELTWRINAPGETLQAGRRRSHFSRLMPNYASSDSGWPHLTDDEVRLGLWAAQRAAGNASLSPDQFQRLHAFLSAARERGLASARVSREIRSRIESGRQYRRYRPPPRDPISTVMARALRRAQGTGKILVLGPRAARWGPSGGGCPTDYVASRASQVAEFLDLLASELSKDFGRVSMLDYSRLTVSEIFEAVRVAQPEGVLLIGPSWDDSNEFPGRERDHALLLSLSPHLEQPLVGSELLPAVVAGAMSRGSHLAHLAMETPNPLARRPGLTAAARRALAEKATHIDVFSLAAAEHPEVSRASNTTLLTYRIGEEGCFLRFSLARSWLDWILRLTPHGVPGIFPRREQRHDDILAFEFSSHDAGLPWLPQLMQPELRAWRSRLNEYGTWTSLETVAYCFPTTTSIEEWIVEVDQDPAPAWAKVVSVADEEALERLRKGAAWDTAVETCLVYDEEHVGLIDEGSIHHERAKYIGGDYGESLDCADAGDLVFDPEQKSYADCWTLIPTTGGPTVVNRGLAVVRFHSQISEPMRRWVSAYLASPICEAVVENTGIRESWAGWVELEHLPIPIPHEGYGRSFELSVHAEANLLRLAGKLAQTRQAIFDPPVAQAQREGLHSVIHQADAIDALLGQADLLSVTIRTLFPFPLALSYRRLLECQSDWSRFKSSLKLAEDVAALAWAFDMIARPNDEAGQRRYRAQVERGISFDFLIQALRDSAGAARTSGLYNIEMLDERMLLVAALQESNELRLSWAHWRTTEESITRADADRAQSAVAKVLHHALFLSTNRLWLIEQVERHAETGVCEGFRGRALIGDHPRGWLLSGSASGAVIVEGQHYLTGTTFLPTRLAEFLFIRLRGHECEDVGVVDKKTSDVLTYRSLLGKASWDVREGSADSS